MRKKMNQNRCGLQLARLQPPRSSAVHAARQGVRIGKTLEALVEESPVVLNVPCGKTVSRGAMRPLDRAPSASDVFHAGDWFEMVRINTASHAAKMVENQS